MRAAARHRLGQPGWPGGDHAPLDRCHRSHPETRQRMTSSTTPPKQSVSGRTSRKTSGGDRRHSDPEARLNRNLTIAFVVVLVTVGVGVVLGLGFGFWEENLKPLANVNGTQIGRGEWRDRQALETFRADRTETTTRAALLAGEIDADLADARLTAAANARNAGPSGAMQSLVDLHYQGQLAKEQGITLSEDELAAAIAADGTLPEERRIAALVISPVGAETDAATPEDVAAARASAEEALAALRSGTPIADLVDQYSPATAGTDGDIGYYTLDRLQGVDVAWAEQLFGLEEGGVSDIADTDFGLLIGVVSAIAPEVPDEGFLEAVRQQVGEGVHRQNVEMEALAAKLEDTINADAAAREYEQVRLAEIVVAGDTLVPADEQQPSVRASHILYRPEPDASPDPSLDPSASPAAEASPSPGASPAPGASQDPDASPAPVASAAPEASPAPVASAAPEASPAPVTSAEPEASAAPEASPAASPSPAPSIDPDASPTPIPSDDPSWDVAQAEADATAADLRAISDVAARMEAFSERARAESDDTGSGSRGGDLGFFQRADMVPEFADAIFDAEGLQQGDIIGPVRSEFGWHVILFDEARGTLAERLAAVQAALAADGADFASVARELSDGPTAPEGGEIGWQVVEDLDGVQQLALTAIDTGEWTEPIDEQRGYAIYLKEEQATRALEPDVAAEKSRTAFAEWYQEQRTAAETEGDISIDASVFDEAAAAAGG
jgi:parvulin-like peptidyl-prolyl isomerase